MSMSVKSQFRDFVIRYGVKLMENAQLRYKALINAVLGQVVRQIDMSSEEEVRDLIRNITSRKTEILKMIEDLKKGDSKSLNLGKEYSKFMPFIQKALNMPDNLIVEALEEFFREFGDI